MMCVGADVMYIKETNILISYMSTQRESFEGQHGGPPSEARRASEGGYFSYKYDARLELV